jgi:hypothetical protein
VICASSRRSATATSPPRRRGLVGTTSSKWDVGLAKKAAVRVVATCTDATNVPIEVRTTFQQHIFGGEQK